MKNLILLFVIISSSLFSQTGFTIPGMRVHANEYGRIRIFNADFAGNSFIDNMSVLVGVSPTSVFDYLQDADSLILPYRTSPEFADSGIFLAIDNGYSNLPPAVIVEENIYGWTAERFLMIKYTVINKEAAPINVVNGLEIISQVSGYYGYDTVSYDFDKKFISISKGIHKAGFKYFSENAASINSLTSFNYYQFYEKDSLYYLKLTNNNIDSNFFANDSGAIIITGHNQSTIAPDDSVVFYYAVTFADSASALYEQIDSATSKYNRIITGVEDFPGLPPSDFTLYQNYPNPFNPATTIVFDIPAEQHVTLKVYNVIGELVATLINEVTPAGTHRINFSSVNLPSGVYFYELNASSTKQVKKMILLR